MFLAIQNSVILDCFSTKQEALDRISSEQSKDMLSIMVKRKLRKLFLKDPSNIALHRYSIVETVGEVVDVK